jgi:hypothetical protein
MYIGIGTVVLILLILLVIYLVDAYKAELHESDGKGRPMHHG